MSPWRGSNETALCAGIILLSPRLCDCLNRKGGDTVTGPDEDNHANQCNQNNDEYWHSRGCEDDEDE